MLESTTSFDVPVTLKQRRSTRPYYHFGSPLRGKYHLGLGKSVTRSYLSKTNQNRDYCIFESLAYYMVEQAQKKL